MIGIYAFHEKVRNSGIYLADGSGDEIRIKLPERMEDPGANIAALALPRPIHSRSANPPRTGKSARGPTTRCASLRTRVGKSWSSTSGESPSGRASPRSPAVGKLAAEFQPRGVEFLAIHNAERDTDVALEQARKVLASRAHLWLWQSIRTASPTMPAARQPSDSVDKVSRYRSSS